MNILYVLDYYYPHIGGVEIVFQRLAESMVERGHRVKVISTYYTGFPLKQILNGVEVERVKTPERGDRHFFTFMNGTSIFRNIRRFDLVHTSAYNGALMAFLASRLANRPIIYTAPEVLGPRWKLVESNPLKASIYSLFERVVTKLPYDHLVAISNSTLRDARRIGVSKEKSSRIYCGVDQAPVKSFSRETDLRKRICAGQNDFLYLYFGRPGITKGVRYLLEAVPNIQQAIPKSHLILILTDQPRSQYIEIRAEIERLQKNHNIHVLPSMESRAELFSSLSGTDCIVFPSLSEGFGLAAAEACQLGVPIVATRAGSLPEVISGRHILIEAASSQAITEAIVRVAHGEWEESPPKYFPWEAMVDGYEEVYKKIIKVSSR